MIIIKLLKIIFLFFILNFQIFGQEKLFPVLNNNLWGFINKEGKIVIEYKFKNVGKFSENLAPARLNGTYGYIDTIGNFVISPQYDIALPFYNDIAQVFINGKPYYIDKKGNIIFQHYYKSISPFKNHSFSIVTTQSGKYGLINKKGILIADTVLKKINLFSDGVSVVYGLNHLPYPKDSTQTEVYETGLIDTNGNWMINYGKYKNIMSFKNGFSTAVRYDQTEKERQWTSDDAIINKSGKLKFIIPTGKYFLDYENKGFSNNLAPVVIYPEMDDLLDAISYNDVGEYAGVVNTDGIILFSDTNWQKITPFTYNRAFIQLKNKKWIFINSKGIQVSDSIFDNVLYNSFNENPEDVFADCTSWVKLSNGWVNIDTNGIFISKPKVFEDIHDSRLTRVNNIIFIEDDISVENPNYSFRYGFWNSKTNTTVNPTYHDIDMYNFNNDLIYAMKDGIFCYINSDGNVIWKETVNTNNQLSYLNIDFMNRGYFYAYSKHHKDDLGGFGSSMNIPKKINRSHKFNPKSLNVFVNQELKDTIYGNKIGVTVFIGNTTNKKINFNAQDSRLYMKVQALDAQNKWRDVEYLPSSWCGNSYHTLTLEPNYFWKFISPIYEGEFKTKLRIELQYIDSNDNSKNRWDKKNITIYSNEYDGSINPGQFWNKREYYSKGLMDPYND